MLKIWRLWVQIDDVESVVCVSFAKTVVKILETDAKIVNSEPRLNVKPKISRLTTSVN